MALSTTFPRYFFLLTLFRFSVSVSVAPSLLFVFFSFSAVLFLLLFSLSLRQAFDHRTRASLGIGSVLNTDYTVPVCVLGAYKIEHV